MMKAMLFHSRAMLIAASLAILATLGCAQYGPISRPAYDYATALYSVSNRKSADKLGGISLQIRKACEAGEISKDEAQWLDEIVQQAQEGEWETAATSSRTMMEEQALR